MKVIIAIDSFKGCMSSSEVSLVVEEAIKNVYDHAEIIRIPIADGGEGTVDTITQGLGGKIVELEVIGPLMKKVLAKYGILNDGTAVIEMASAAGLPLLNIAERNPLKTTTYGVGELIKDAISKGCREFIIGLGGSATNDAGIGMLKALGYRFYDDNHTELDCVGESLNLIKYIDDRHKLKVLSECNFLVASDVNNPLYGKNGAAHIYARQKGADHQMIEILDRGLRNFAEITNEKYNLNIEELPGAGAAGGLGYGICAFLKGTLKSGIQIVFDKIDFDSKVKDADLIITGEGKIDHQSSMGKVLTGIAHIGKKYQIPVIGIAGVITEDAYKLHDFGITSLFSILNYPMSLEEAMDKELAMGLTKKTVIEIFRLLKYMVNIDI
ncbi:MAG: glycerate kinase [Haloplasmataceae bacterium]|nr:glycerate kinase [Haloplasmataceae bacterium]